MPLVLHRMILGAQSCNSFLWRDAVVNDALPTLSAKLSSPQAPLLGLGSSCHVLQQPPSGSVPAVCRPVPTSPHDAVAKNGTEEEVYGKRLRM